ncbi:hypothetical protein NKR19_g10268 [Coniochaeta hoffmannii]|uniref:Uncharacterized protein n=1 Tax=Coniochaeta hoffmannii TaxID=91930 RepID=A0AA38R196_9PEZI|nr:hypothetical protein NKR19_g10268 [Coniochaeta hoffmannii]
MCPELVAYTLEFLLRIDIEKGITALIGIAGPVTLAIPPLQGLKILACTNGDGSEDVNERVDTCRPGKMCLHPARREYQRQHLITRHGRQPSRPAANPLRHGLPPRIEHFLEVHIPDITAGEPVVVVAQRCLQHKNT